MRGGAHDDASKSEVAGGAIKQRRTEKMPPTARDRRNGRTVTVVTPCVRMLDDDKLPARSSCGFRTFHSHISHRP